MRPLILLTYFFLISRLGLAATNSNLPRTSKSQTTPPCTACSWSVDQNILNQPQDQNACEDLAPVACQNAKGEFKSQALFAKIEVSLKAAVKAAQDKAAQKAGEATFSDFIMKGLSKKGFVVKKDISQKAKNYLLGDYSEYAPADEIYEIVHQCLQERKNLESLKPLDAKTIADVQAIQKQIDDFNEKYKGERIKLFTQNIPGFISKLNDQCRILVDSADVIKRDHLEQHPRIVRLKNICASKSVLREKAVRFYLKQDQADVQKEILAFVQENFDLLSLSVSFMGSEKAATDLLSWQSKTLIDLNGISSTCYTLNDGFTGAPTEVVRNLSRSINLSRGFMEALLPSIYTESRHAKILEIFNRVRQEAYLFATRLTQDERKLSGIRETFKRMKITWFANPSSWAYKKDPVSGLDIFDVSSVSTFSPIGQVFDGEVDFFTSVNAFYMPDTAFGNRVSDVSVTMQPALIELLDENPYAFTSVLAHEAGHNLDPDVSQMNGYSLEEEYKPILQCLSSPASIHMKSEQAAESAPDVVAAEITGRIFGELPVESRKAAAYSSLQVFCHFLDKDALKSDYDFEANHPDPGLRISGIFGGNPSFRKLLACEKPASSFQTCSIDDKISLDTFR